MTEQNKASWASFGGNIQVDDSTFTDQVGGSKFLEPGKYEDVVISSIEPKTSKAGNFYVMARFENEEGAGINYNIILTGTDKEGNQQFHWVYKQLGAAICDDPELRLRFFGDFLPATPEMFKGLVGLKATIKVKKGSEGYEIKDVSTGGKIIVDVETAEQWEDTDIYEDFTEAIDAAKESGLRRCYNEVAQVTKPTEEAMTTNKEVLESLMVETKPAKKVAGKGKPTPKKKQPVSI